MQTTRKTQSIFNQLVAGHPRLNQHLSRIKAVDSPICNNCAADEEETIDHFLFVCDAFTEQRSNLERRVYETLQKENLRVGCINLGVLVGEVSDISKGGRDDFIKATLDYIVNTERF